jgi:hypothetical protein
MTLVRSILTVAFFVIVQQGPTQPASAQTAPAPDLETILADPKIVKTLDDIKADDARAFAEQKHITEIPAPPFK